MLNLRYKKSPLPGGGYLIHLEVSESAPKWPVIHSMIQRTRALDISDTLFTDTEILVAPWSRLIPVFEQGYPQPEATWSAEPVTFGGECSECGIYKKEQLENFRIRKEPRLGNNSFVSLYWTYALFATPAVFAELATRKLQGFREWKVLIHKTDQISENISQIYIPEQTSADFVPEETFRRSKCPKCGAVKYFPHLRGVMRFKGKISESTTDFLLSREWFGDGHAAYREILVSKEVARLIVESKLRGVKLKPIQINP